MKNFYRWSLLIILMLTFINCGSGGGSGGGSNGPRPTSNAVLVSANSPSASDANSCLSPSAPCLTIGGGIARAVATGKTEVRVADGIYQEQVTLVSGIDLRGGYSQTWKEQPSTNTHILRRPGTDARAVIAKDILSPTTFSGFIVTAPDAATPGASSYAVWVRDSDANLTISSNVLFAGSGAAGQNGSYPTNGADGGLGENGLNAVDIVAAYGVAIHGCVNAGHARPGGAGGADDCGGSAAGGTGGSADCPLFTNGAETDPQNAIEAGAAGAGSGGGSGGAAGRDVYHQAFTCLGYAAFAAPEAGHGGNGAHGADGAVVAPPASADGGVNPAGLRVGPASAPGQDGINGSGGGGGGSGGGAYMHDSCVAKSYGGDNLGGTGGGGGSGGCAGAGGSAGQAGGGSFGIFVSFSAPPASLPAIFDNTIHTGFGGDGGRGGSGGRGGTGGTGGNGGNGRVVIADTDPAYPAFPGGRGGNGGDGGHGSGGGGGCGGPSYGIFAHNFSPADPGSWKTDNAVIVQGAGGAAGTGGSSWAATGPDGLPGSQSDANF